MIRESNSPTRYQAVIDRLKRWARAIKRDLHALYLAARDPDVPWYAKAIAIVVVAYALAPIDLIPDFIPVLGYLDELILLPLGIMLVVSLIPPGTMEKHRAAADNAQRLPVSMAAAVVIALVWIAVSAAIGYELYRRYNT